MLERLAAIRRALAGIALLLLVALLVGGERLLDEVLGRGRRLALGLGGKSGLARRLLARIVVTAQEERGRATYGDLRMTRPSSSRRSFMAVDDVRTRRNLRAEWFARVNSPGGEH